MNKKSLLLAYFIVLLLLSTALMNTGGASVLPRIYVDPPKIMDEALQVDTYFTINITVADVTYLEPLAAYDVKIAWNASLLDYATVIEGPFLKQGGDTWFVVKKSQGNGSISVGSWLLAPYDPVYGSGVVVYITFRVETYGHTLLDLWGTELYTPHAGGDPIPLDHTVEDGYFSNKIRGDIDGDGDVDRYDFGDFGMAYGSEPGDSNWNPDCDLDWDGDVDRYDFGDFGMNYGRHI